jgi:predicted  nucleic acid-binding Zn-ribbon protein
MPRTKSVNDKALLQAALEGLELQKQRIEDQIREVRSRLGPGRRAAPPGKTAEAPPRRRRRRLSAEARKRIAAAQKKRWDAFRKKTSGGKGAAKGPAKGAPGE